jgi:hypothetical protein
VEFDRVLIAIQAGTARFQGLSPEEIAKVVAVLEEKRAEDLARKLTHPGYPSRFAGRVQTTITADPRVKAIFDARLVRRRVEPEGPVRYLGFDTTPAFRVFRFGRLPPRDSNDLFEVLVAHCHFGPKLLSLQEGPGLCTSLLLEKNYPATYEVTAEDVQEFLGRKTVKGGKR